MIKISQEIQATEIPLTLGIIRATVLVEASNEAFVNILNQRVAEVEETFTIENYKTPALEASRKLYRKLGKDPSRYRISSDSLMRRIIKKKGIYYVNNVVDINNLISLETLWSIGAYDYEKLQGELTYGVGQKEDHYEGIGRGLLNIENLPVLSDDLGPFGSATSDSLRSMVTDNTRDLLMVIHGIGQDDQMIQTLDKMVGYLKVYASAEDVETMIINS